MPQDAWTTIRYPRAIWDDQLQAWVSDAEAAETTYTAFAHDKDRAVTARLIIRRVRDLNKKAAAGQGELFPVYRYHAVLTDSPFELVQAEGQHRDHAIEEQVFADWNDGPLAHLPSGRFAANAAWLAVAAMTYNLVRAAGALASLPFAKAQGRDHPPRPDRRRRPHRPPRPGNPHPAPARSLAPRNENGSTSGNRHAGRPLPRPDQPPTRSAPRRPPSQPDPRPGQEPRTSRRTRKQQKKHARKQLVEASDR